MLYTISIVQECHTAVDSIGLLVGDLNAKFLYARLIIKLPLGKHVTTNLLNCHDDLDGVQAVESKVVGEVCGGGELLRVSMERVHGSARHGGVYL